MTILITCLVLLLICGAILQHAHKILCEASMAYQESINDVKLSTHNLQEAKLRLQQVQETEKAVTRRVQELRAVYQELQDRVEGKDWTIDWLEEDND